MNKYQDELNLAKHCVTQVAQYFEQINTKVLSSLNKDIKAKADKDSDDLIIKLLSENSSYPILSEEEYPKNLAMRLMAHTGL